MKRFVQIVSVSFLFLCLLVLTSQDFSEMEK